MGPAAEFIAPAERTGEIAAVGRRVLNSGCCEAVAWPSAWGPATSVNVSITQVESGTFLGDVSDALRKSGLPAERPKIALTESVFAGDRSKVISTLTKLREQGIKSSLDDFDPGFSCLADLWRLPLDQVKINKWFVGSISCHGGDLGVEVDAEAVRPKPKRRRWARTIFRAFFSKPRPPAMAREWLLYTHAAEASSRRAVAGIPSQICCFKEVTFRAKPGLTVLRLDSIRVVVLAGLVASAACAPRQSATEKREEANTPAGKVGQAAHRATVEAEKAGREISRKLDKAAHDAKEGWKEDASKTKKSQ